MSRSKEDYWIFNKTCINNAFYNVYFLDNQKTHKVKCGVVSFKGKYLFGGDVNISTKDFEVCDSHFWVETKDGMIIDWVINAVTKDTTHKIHNKAEMEALGFKYEYYTNMKAITLKTKKRFGKCGEIDRRCFGEMF